MFNIRIPWFMERDRFVYIGWSGIVLLPSAYFSLGAWFTGTTFVTSWYSHGLAAVALRDGLSSHCIFCHCIFPPDLFKCVCKGSVFHVVPKVDIVYKRCLGLVCKLGRLDTWRCSHS